MLIAMRDGEENYAISEGLEVWVDYDRYSYQTLLVLLRSCLISLEQTSSFEQGGCSIWLLNEDGEKIIDNPEYVPLYWQEMRRRNK